MSLPARSYPQVCVLLLALYSMDTHADSCPPPPNPEDVLFADCFKSGDTSAWASTVGGGGEPAPQNGIIPGAEFAVGATAGDQGRPQAAADAAGNFVVVWDSSASPGGSDSLGLSIQSLVFDSDATVTVSQMQVNTYTTGDQSDPEVARHPDGDFVVVWRSTESSMDDSYGSIQAQRFGSDGSPIGSEFQVNSYTTGDQRNPSVAIASSNRDFAVVWESDGSPDSDSGGFSIQGQRYASDGSAVGGQFQVNSDTTGMQTRAQVTFGSGGDFLVVWQSDSSSINGGSGIFGQSFDAAGMSLGSEFALSSSTTEYQYAPQMVGTAEGGFVVVWENKRSTYPSSDRRGEPIFRIRGTGSTTLRDNGVLLAGFDVSGGGDQSENDPALTIDSEGNLVVVWRRQDPLNSGLLGRTLLLTDNDADPTSAVFPIGRGEPNESRGLPVVVFTTERTEESEGRFEVIFQEQDARRLRGPSQDVTGQRFIIGPPELFADGFESGDLSAW
ncbi:MAG: hypothetical protein AAF560_25050 [Acidobacteriota bacterium]